MTQITGTLRGRPKGQSTLGGATRCWVFTTTQFLPVTLWPQKTDIVNGLISTAIPVINDFEAAAQIIFDFDSQAHGKSAGTTTATQFSYKHSISGRVNGITIEGDIAINEIVQRDLILIVERPNGERRVYGTTYKPMRMKVDDDFGGKADDYVGSTIEFMQVDAVDFRPPVLAANLVFWQVLNP